MTNEDIKKRIDLLKGLGLYDENNSITSMVNSQALANFTDKQIIEAASAHAQVSAYPVKPFDICEYWRKRSGNTEEDIKAGLAIKAEQVFNEMIRKANSANDWIVADARASVTIKALYVSPQRFSRMDKIEDGNDWPRKNFIKRYQEVTAEELSEAQHHFGGAYANTVDPLVTFLGGYAECMQLAGEVYAGRKPRLPHNPDIKALPAVKVCEQLAPDKVSRQYLGAIAQMLAKAVKTPSGKGVLLK